MVLCGGGGTVGTERIRWVGAKGLELFHAGPTVSDSVRTGTAGGLHDCLECLELLGPGLERLDPPLEIFRPAMVGLRPGWLKDGLSKFWRSNPATRPGPADQSCILIRNFTLIYTEK